MSIQTESIYELIDDQSLSTLDWGRLLSDILNAFDCTTGTIHTYDAATDLLLIKAYQGIPEFLLPKMSQIPVGKGMAGIAAQRREPVQICNLQTDESGVARPSAKDTKVEGSLTAPLLYLNTLYGTLGIAKPVPYEFSNEEIAVLMDICTHLARKIADAK